VYRSAFNLHRFAPQFRVLHLNGSKVISTYILGGQINVSNRKSIFTKHILYRPDVNLKWPGFAKLGCQTSAVGYTNCFVKNDLQLLPLIWRPKVYVLITFEQFRCKTSNLGAKRLQTGTLSVYEKYCRRATINLGSPE